MSRIQIFLAPFTMQDGGVHTVEIVFLLLLLFVAAFGALASRLRTPYPIVLVIAGAPSRNTEEEEARRVILEAALNHLEKARENDRTDFAEVFDDLELQYQGRLATLTDEDADIHSKRHRRFAELSRELLRVERQTAVRLRNDGRINDELLRQFERELDLAEARFLPGGA